MSASTQNIAQYFKGYFIHSPEAMQQKLMQCKAFVFDWDGVFNDGTKDNTGSSPFSEVDSMGTNLLRFSYYLLTGIHPFVAIISGEKNGAAFNLAQREHFDNVYFKIKHKAAAIEHFCEQHQLQPHEICFVFDDVLDFSAAAMVGVRIMVKHAATALLQQYAIEKNWVDYLTNAAGGQHAVRETTELLMALHTNYNATIEGRTNFSDAYKSYLQKRQEAVTSFYTATADNSVTPALI
jgi:3-deoxy-D-manno-octulosonate 8-phosphate phosphatase (KDO 8-P phosphatase)